MRSFEEVRDLLADKFRIEKKRLKTFGTKANSFDLANVIAKYVLALMAESRSREMKRLDKMLDTCSTDDHEKINKYITERIKATSGMAKIIHKYAVEAEKNRPWSSKAEQKARIEEEKRIARKVKKLKEKKHGHKGSARSSRH